MTRRNTLSRAGSGWDRRVRDENGPADRPADEQCRHEAPPFAARCRIVGQSGPATMSAGDCCRRSNSGSVACRPGPRATAADVRSSMMVTRPPGKPERTRQADRRSQGLRAGAPQPRHGQVVAVGDPIAVVAEHDDRLHVGRRRKMRQQPGRPERALPRRAINSLGSPPLDRCRCANDPTPSWSISSCGNLPARLDRRDDMEGNHWEAPARVCRQAVRSAAGSGTA